MTHATDRRTFIQTSLATAVGTAAMNVSKSRAVEPIARTAGSHFKFSMAAYSYRDLLGGKAKHLKIDDFLDDCASFGLDGTELTSYYLPQDGPHEYFRELKGVGWISLARRWAMIFAFPQASAATRKSPT